MFRSHNRDVKGPASSLAISSPGIWHYARAANELALSEPVSTIHTKVAERGEGRAMRFANGTAMNLLRLGLFLTACAISANSAQAGGSATPSLPPPDSIEANQRTFHPGRLFHPGSLAV